MKSFLRRRYYKASAFSPHDTAKTAWARVIADYVSSRRLKVLNYIVGILLSTIMSVHSSFADTCNSGTAGNAQNIISSPCANWILWSSGNLVVTQAGSINNFLAVTTNPGPDNPVGALLNDGSVTGLIYLGPVYGYAGDVTSLINNGELNPDLSFRPFPIQNDLSLGQIVNNGFIGGFILNQDGSIGELVNAQGSRSNVSGDMALNYQGKLPTLYQVVVNSTSYGKLAVTGAAPPNPTTSQMTFGVYSGSTLSNSKQRYASVLSGVSSSLLANMSGTSSTGRAWRLIDNGDDSYDLEIDGVVIGRVGPNVLNTYQALTSNKDALLGAIHQRYAVLNNVSQYDCNRFDKYGVCLSLQDRGTGWGSQTTGAGVFNIAYRPHNNIRVGAYIDYQVAQATPFGTNPALGGLQYGYNNPTFGGYVGFSQSGYNGTPINSGLQAFMSGGYNPGKVTITRAMLDGTEPGQGTAGLNAYYAYGTMGYGFNVADKTIVVPYGGLLYTNVIRNSYQEQANVLVQNPLGYNAFYEQLLTGVFGGRVQSMVTDKLGCNVGAGAQFDLTRNANSYSGYSYISGMEAYGVAHGGSWNGARPTGQVGVFYNVNKNEQLLLNTYAGQQAYTTRTYTSLLAGYQLSF